MRTMQGIAGATMLALALTACGGGAQTPQQTPSPSSTTTTQPADKAMACKAAMVQQFIDAMASGKTGTRPKECVGVDDKTVEKFAEQILSGETETTTP